MSGVYGSVGFTVSICICQQDNIAVSVWRMDEAHFDHCILDLNAPVMAFSPLWLKVFVAIQCLRARTHTHTHTHTYTHTHKRTHAFLQNVFCNIVPTITSTLFSDITKHNFTFIWSVLYLSVVHKLKNPGFEFSAVARGLFSYPNPSSPNLVPINLLIKRLLVSLVGGKSVGQWICPLTPI
jgi:hypothetical protein